MAEKNKTEFDKGKEKYQEILSGSGEGLVTQDFKNVMNRRKKMADEGLSQAELGAMKGKVARQMLQAEQKAARGLGSVLGQQKGAGAAAQQRALSEAGMTARAGIERDLFLTQEEAKRSALDKYEDSVKFDVKKRAQAKEFLSSGGFAFEGLQAQRDSIAAQEAAARANKEKSRVGAGIGAAAGTGIGYAVGGPAGGAIGGALGSVIGGLFD